MSSLVSSNKDGILEIRIVGNIGNIPLIPDNCDIKDIMFIFENVEKLLNFENKKIRPIISYNIAGGSVVHKFKTSLQQVIAVAALITSINQTKDINFLQYPTAQAIANFQDIAIWKDCEILLKAITLNNEYSELKIDKNSKYFLSPPI